MVGGWWVLEEEGVALEHLRRKIISLTMGINKAQRIAHKEEVNVGGMMMRNS